ncbi:MAG: hypothetical protein Kow0058_04590 [Roseovarius sp.]
MYGVVLWSDSERNKAVIWCEDHQSLAFFRRQDEPGESGPQGGFAPGDLVQFDLREENELRLAVDPCLVAPHEFPALAARLKSASAGLRRKPISVPAAPAAPRREGALAGRGQGAGVVVLHPSARRPRRTEQREVQTCC